MAKCGAPVPLSLDAPCRVSPVENLRPVQRSAPLRHVVRQRSASAPCSKGRLVSPPCSVLFNVTNSFPPYEGVSDAFYGANAVRLLWPGTLRAECPCTHSGHGAQVIRGQHAGETACPPWPGQRASPLPFFHLMRTCTAARGKPDPKRGSTRRRCRRRPGRVPAEAVHRRFVATFSTRSFLFATPADRSNGSEGLWRAAEGCEGLRPLPSLCIIIPHCIGRRAPRQSVRATRAPCAREEMGHFSGPADVSLVMDDAEPS